MANLIRCFMWRSALRPPSSCRQTATAPRAAFSSSSWRSQNSLYDDEEPSYAPTKVETKMYLQLDKPFQLHYGATLPKVQIAYETWGEMNKAKDNVIFLQTGLTASSHARSHEGVEGSGAGWWENFVGPGGKIDTNKFMVVCPNSLGSCYGTTGPGSLNPEDNKPYGSNFPAISLKDMVELNAILLEHLGVETVHAVVGPSLGGATSPLFAALFPGRVNRLVSISGCPSAVPLAIAFRYLQRCAIMNDPAWNKGDYYDGKWPTDGLKFARKISTITYRGGNEWNRRFGRTRVKHAPTNHPILYGEEFTIEDYIEYQGTVQASNIKFDPNTLIHISKALDVFDIADHFDSFENAMSRIKCPSLIMGSSSDILYPSKQQKAFYEGIKGQGNEDAQLVIVDSDYGHDAFILEVDNIGTPMKDFLEKDF